MRIDGQEQRAASAGTFAQVRTVVAISLVWAGCCVENLQY